MSSAPDYEGDRRFWITFAVIVVGVVVTLAALTLMGCAPGKRSPVGEVEKWDHTF